MSGDGGDGHRVAEDDETPSLGGEAGAKQMFAGGGGTPSEAGAGPRDQPNVCALPTADCDGTPETECESDVDWNARHCGGCGNRCDGACRSGECGLEEPILESARATDILGGDPYYYVLTSQRQLLRVARATAEVNVLASELGDELLEPPDALARAGSSLFIWTRSDDSPVQRVPLAGGPALSEPFIVESFGASDAGVYFVAENALWFRASDEAAPQELTYVEPRIICSSPSLVLIQANTPEPVLLGAIEGQLGLWGPAPPALEQARCDSTSAVLLAGGPRARRVFRVSEYGVDDGTPLEPSLGVVEGGLLNLYETYYGGGFDLTFKVQGNVHVRHYDFRNEASKWAMGLPLNSELVYRDADYVWYNSSNNGQWVSQFKRAHYISKSAY
jgi:hypothetical protein